MQYAHVAIGEVPQARVRLMQHALDTYASETNKVYSTWLEFEDADLDFRPHERSSSVGAILQHQLLSERRFFAEFLGLPEPAATEVLPAHRSVRPFADRLVELAIPRLHHLAGREKDWWLGETKFFDAVRERSWVFWRRVLHTAHHRTQLTVYLRLLGKEVPSTYGPTADVTWEGASPTLTVEKP